MRLDLSVGQRLAIGSAIVVVLILVLGGVAASSISEVRALRQERLEVIGPRAAAAEDLRVAVYQQAIAFRNFAMTGVPADLQTFRDSQANVAQRLERLEAMPMSSEGRALFDRVTAMTADHGVSFEAFLGLVSSGATRESLREQELLISGNRTQLLAVLDAFVALKEERARVADRKISGALEALDYTVRVVTLLVLLASVATTFAVGRAVRRPAAELVSAADALRRGSFDEAVALAGESRPDREGGLVRHRDELREAAGAFGRMAIALKEREERLASLAAELQRSNDFLQQQNEELQAQREELQAQSEELQTQNEELQSQSEELQAQSEELRFQGEALARTNESLVEAEAQKNRFLAVLGHELRNPLAAVHSAASLLDASRGERVPEEAVDVINRQTVHLTRMVDDLLDVGRITSGKVVLARRPVEVAAAAERCVRAACSEGGPRIELEAAGHFWADADETRLEQIVTNLLTNSVKHTPPGGRITVQVSGDSSRTVLRVSDTGAGIEPELLPRIFDFFVQGEGRPHAAKGGLGVGLTLVRSLVELHGGTVEAASPGRGLGTTVTVTLPAIPAPAMVPVGAAAPESRPTPARRSVVVIEDNADVRGMMLLVLRRAGHAVTEAADGPSGVETVKTVRPDVALVDLDLPGFDGFEVARRVRMDGDLSTVVLIALSGYGSPHDRTRALDAGFSDHLVKPVDLKTLQQVLEK